MHGRRVRVTERAWVALWPDLRFFDNLRLSVALELRDAAGRAGNLFLADVPLIPYPLHFTDGAELSTLVSTQQPVALMENNGALILGKAILDAFDRLEVLESTAEALINSKNTGWRTSSMNAFVAIVMNCRIYRC